MGKFFSKLIAACELTFDDFHEHRSPGLVCPWIPRRRDILFMVNFFKASSCSQVADLGCGYGFLGWLLAMEGIPVTGIDVSPEIENSTFNHSLLTLVQGSLEEKLPDRQLDGALLSWPNQGYNPAGIIKEANFRAVIYAVETSSLTGDAYGRYILDLLEKYKPVFYWDNINYRDLNSSLYRHVMSSFSAVDLPPSMKSSHNRVILFLRKDLDEKSVADKMETFHRQEKISRYPWEDELDKFYREKEILESGRITLWKLKKIDDEINFIKQMSYTGMIERGLVL